MRPAALALAALVARGAVATADPPPPRGATWALAWRRTCRTYAPLPGLALDPRRDVARWCFARFAAGDGRYLGAVPVDTALAVAPVFLPDGRELTVARGRGGLRLEAHAPRARTRVPLGPALAGLASARPSPGGESALVERGGRRVVVALPDGRAVFALPAGTDVTHAAVSPQGDRLATGSARAVTVYARRGDGWVALALLAEPSARLAFARDGRTLLIERGDDALLSAWREGGSPRAPLAALPVAPPPGFVAGRGAPPWLPSRAGGGPRPGREHGLAGSYLHPASGVGVAVYATDAGELRALTGRHTGWARAVLDRYASGLGGGITGFRQERGGARSVWWREPASGRAPGWQIDVRATERAGVLYRVEVLRPRPCARRSEPGCGGASVGEAALRAFAAAPFDARPAPASGAQRAVASAPRRRARHASAMPARPPSARSDASR